MTGGRQPSLSFPFPFSSFGNETALPGTKACSRTGLGPPQNQCFPHTPPTLTPAVPPYVKLGLTIVYTVFYSLLFVFIYVQLWLVLRYRHKRLSYQSVFLFLCLFWASLRTVLFSFYFKDFVAANALSPFVFWLLYCFPVCLQFFTLTLMNLYFTQVSRGRPPPPAGDTWRVLTWRGRWQPRERVTEPWG